MSWIKRAKEEEFKTIKLKSLRKNLEVTPQIGRSNLARDRKRKALAPGKRISKTGNVYWETRKNRSDLKGKI
jgi:hypothetical protein